MLNFMNIRLPRAQLVTGRHTVQIRRLRLPVPLTIRRPYNMLLFRLSCQLGAGSVGTLDIPVIKRCAVVK